MSIILALREVVFLTGGDHVLGGLIAHSDTTSYKAYGGVGVGGNHCFPVRL